MTDTPRIRSDLQALFPSTGSGDASAQDLRDFMVSLFNMAAVTVVSSTSHDVVDGDLLILTDYTATGVVTVRCMTDQLEDGRMFIIKDSGMNASKNAVTITSQSSETFDGAASLTIDKDGGGYVITSDGTNFHVAGIIRPTVAHTRTFYIEDPTATDDFPICSVPAASTITRVTHITDTGTVDFNLEERLDATPDVAGTDVFAADDQAGSTTSVVTAFDNDSLAANSWLAYCASAVASTPTKLWIAITYETEG